MAGSFRSSVGFLLLNSRVLGAAVGWRVVGLAVAAIQVLGFGVGAGVGHAVGVVETTTHAWSALDQILWTM